MEHPVLEVSRVILAIELIGVVAFAVSGALIAIEREMDIFGVLVLALITALGGGVIRDIIADRFPVSLHTPIYFYTALAGTLCALPFRKATPKSLYWLKVFDALGLAMFSVLGARIGIIQDNFLATVLLGLLTGIGGGMLRDILANEIPLVLRQEIYALASIIGITILWLMVHLGFARTTSTITGALIIFAIRLAAIQWNLNLPHIRRG